MNRAFQDWIPAAAEDFFFSETSRPFLGPAQPPVQWETDRPPGNRGVVGANLTTHLHLALRFKCELAVCLVAWTGSALRGLLEKYPTFGREKETGLLGVLDT